MKEARRQRIRKSILLVMVGLFPATCYYFSPYLIIMGGSEGIIVGSLLTFSAMFAASLLFGRLFCGWLCPAGGLQELLLGANSRKYNGRKRNLVKYVIWIPWMSIIAFTFIRAGGTTAIDFLYQTYYGISISDTSSVVTFVFFETLIGGVALGLGKRALYHSGCWMVPFMILGRKICNSVN